MPHDPGAQKDAAIAELAQSPFRPAFWARSGFLQTVAAAYGRQARARDFVLQRWTLPDGDFVRITPVNAVLPTYCRPIVLHLVAMPSMIACCFISNSAMRTADVQRLAWRIYPYISAELFLRWPEAELSAVTERALHALGERGLLEHAPGTDVWRRPPPTSVNALQLSLLAQATVQTIDRYYLSVALLVRAGSGTITQKALEERCQQMAQRMTLLYGFNSPEFHDRALFESFIDLLRSRGVIRVDEAGKLVFDEVLDRVASDAELVLSDQIRHSILQGTHG